MSSPHCCCAVFLSECMHFFMFGLLLQCVQLDPLCLLIPCCNFYMFLFVADVVGAWLSVCCICVLLVLCLRIVFFRSVVFCISIFLPLFFVRILCIAIAFFDFYCSSHFLVGSCGLSFVAWFFAISLSCFCSLFIVSLFSTGICCCCCVVFARLLCVCMYSHVCGCV